MRVPVTGYSLDIGKAHTDFAEAKLQQRLIERKLSDEEINQLAVVAMAGATAEAMNYEQACLGLLTYQTFRAWLWHAKVIIHIEHQIVAIFAQVQGQVADLTDLQRILQRSEQKLSNAQQQNMTVCCYKHAPSNVSNYMAVAYAILVILCIDFDDYAHCLP